MTVNPLSLQEKVPVSLVTEKNRQKPSNRTCDGPSSGTKSVSCIERYALVLAEGLEAPPLLVNPCVTMKQLQAAAEADIARLKKTIESDNRLFADLLECITTIRSTVPRRDLKTERKVLLDKVLQDLPGIDDRPMPDSREEIAFRLRKAVLTVASRVRMVFERFEERGFIGHRYKLNETGTVQGFTDHQLQVHDEVLSSQTKRETINTDVKKRKYSTNTVKTDRVTQDCTIETTETQTTVTRILAGVEEHDLQAPFGQPARISRFTARCNSPLGKQFRLLTGVLCNYRESEELLRQYEHHMQEERIEQNMSREIHYRQMGRDIAAVTSGIVTTIGSIFAAKVSRFTEKPVHTDPTICFGEFVLTGFLPDGFDLTAFQENEI